MLVSYRWLKTFFESNLPSADIIAEAITMHAFEIESVVEMGGDTVLEVKILPNRAHDCLSHRGIAAEIAALFDIKMNEKRFEKYAGMTHDAGIEVQIEDAKLCPRYVGRLIENIDLAVGPPREIKERLETLGQRSINTVVDICNYVMFDIGQPMHAFDADNVKGVLQIRLAHTREKITTLDGKEFTLDESTLVIADDEGPLAIAGIKGGNRAEVNVNTKRIILEAANFNPSLIRKTSQKIGIKTDASKRFENEITPSLARAGIEYATALVVENVSREAVVHECVDVQPRKPNPYKVGVSVSEINRLLGTKMTEDEVSRILDRFGWEWELVDPLEKILELAPTLVDKPYKLGASVVFDAPNLFDCSSLTAYLYAQAGIVIPRISIDQFVFGESVDFECIKEGDLLFFNTKHHNGKVWLETEEWMKGTKVKEGVSHVGLYIGNGEIIHATKHYEKVIHEKLEESGRMKDFVGVRRMPGLAEKRFVVTAPAVRPDLRLKEDVIEDIGRVYGYDRIPTTIPKAAGIPDANKLFYYSQKMRSLLASQGFDEVQTYAFQGDGEVELENPLASDKKFLRADLSTGLSKALDLNAYNAELLGLDEVKIFEIGTVFNTEYEDMRLGIALRNIKKDKKKEADKIKEAINKVFIEIGASNTSEEFNRIDNGVIEISLWGIIDPLPDPKDYHGVLEVSSNHNKYKSLSPYPFVLRDIAVWVPAETPVAELEGVIADMGGSLLVKYRQFDTFTKEFETGEKKTSYAFHLVFQSEEKTLSDIEINEVMEKLQNKIMSKGWEVR